MNKNLQRRHDAEINRHIRGQDFFTPELVRKVNPPLDQVVDRDSLIVLSHFFAPGYESFVTHYNAKEDRGYGFVMLGDATNAEWGSLSLVEVEQTVLYGGIVIERDVFWNPKPFSELRQDHAWINQSYYYMSQAERTEDVG